MSDWRSQKDQRDAQGLLTPLALALDAIEDNGCDCGVDEEGSCLACLCEAALKDAWARLARLEAKVEAHGLPDPEQQRRMEHGDWTGVENAAGYHSGLADALAIMQGREPSQPDPVAP